MHKQSGRQTTARTYGQTDRQTDRQTERQTDSIRGMESRMTDASDALPLESGMESLFRGEGGEREVFLRLGLEGVDANPVVVEGACDRSDMSSISSAVLKSVDKGRYEYQSMITKARYCRTMNAKVGERP